MSTNNPRRFFRVIREHENTPRMMPLYHRHGVGEGRRQLTDLRPVYRCMECDEIFCLPAADDQSPEERCHCHCES